MIRIGRPPALHPARRVARWVWRHVGNPAVYWLAMTGAMVATVYGGVRLIVAVMPHAQAPINFAEWTVAIVAVGSLVGAHLLSPRPKRPTRPVRRAPRAAFHSGVARFRQVAARAGTPSVVPPQA